MATTISEYYFRISARTAALAAVLLWWAPNLVAQPAPIDGLDATILKCMQDWRVPGLAVAVAKDGRLELIKGYGIRETGKTPLVDTHTLFAIGSTTKAMTAAAIGMLVDEKRVAWDDPVTKHLPWFQVKDPYVTREMTVRDLLTHRAGLANADFLWYGQDNPAGEILRRVRLMDPAYSVRSGFVYHNVMYAAAGAVVESAAGMTWADFVRKRIFEPLEMSDSFPTAATLSRQPNVASPHFLIDNEVRVIENASVDAVAPAGAVWSSASDMAKWMQFLLSGGQAGGPGGKRLLSEAAFAELFRPQTVVAGEFYPTARLTRPHWTTYGLGWFQQDYQGRAVDFHTGSIDGMVAIHGLIRDERLGICVLGNLDHAELRHALMYTVFDRYGGRSNRDWSVELLKLYGDIRKSAEEQVKKREAGRVAGTSPSLALEKYAGTYNEPLFGDAVVAWDGSRLRIRRGNGFTGTLEHWHYDTFRAVWTAAWRPAMLISFTLDPQGNAGILELMGARFTRKKSQ